MCKRVQLPDARHPRRPRHDPPPCARAQALAEATGGTLVTLEGAGHCPQARDPVKVNLHAPRLHPARRAPTAPWTRARHDRRRALYISSPIGLGHARATSRSRGELRAAGAPISRSTGSPSTRHRGARGAAASASIPASAQLAERVAAHRIRGGRARAARVPGVPADGRDPGCELHGLPRPRAATSRYDLWIGDEAWELDYFLHENPELKTAAYVWLTDFVGWLPMPDGGEREALLTADYNAEMLEHIARYPRVRDRSLFVGDPDDVVPGRFGEGLPRSATGPSEHFDFTGYVTGFDPRDGRRPRRAARRARLRRPRARVHRHRRRLGRRRAPAAARDRELPEAKRLVPELRMIVVAGPRIDPGPCRARDGLEIRGYVHDLYRHLAACDLAIVQGGLTTTMELTANQRPFIYFPLERHFEQNLHVRHRLERYGAGRRMDYRDSPPDAIAAAIARGDRPRRRLPCRSRPTAPRAPRD